MHKKRSYIRRKPAAVKNGGTKNPHLVFTLMGLTGGVLIVAGIAYLVYIRTILSFSNPPKAYLGLYNRPGKPVSIDIPAIDLTVRIREAVIRNGVWQTDMRRAMHLSASANPGENGNIIIYGHNTSGIFADLQDVKTGNSIILTTDTGAKNAYIIESIETVTPDNLAVIAPTKEEILTVYTCTGFLDSQRLVIRAHPAFTATVKSGH
jgi:LPXTG-site transpeptidase (sortase) family protein